ncbi:hypothetical protein VTK56DRAFT_9256 [Thermocarpiscus australiensis]
MPYESTPPCISGQDIHTLHSNKSYLVKPVKAAWSTVTMRSLPNQTSRVLDPTFIGHLALKGPNSYFVLVQ